MTEDAPLLAAWEKFARTCLNSDNPEQLGDEMMTFFAGASVVVNLVRSAAKQGGGDEASRAFICLGHETDAFLEAILAHYAGPGEPRH